MATVDEILGAPTVDEVLGPDTPQPTFTRPAGGIPPGSRRTTDDELTDASTVGRVLDAFGQGAKTGWGSEPLGLSPESEKWLRDNKIFDDYSGGFFASAKAINEAFMRPTAAVLDGVFRSVRAGVYSLAGGAGQAAYEAGIAETPGRATRDLVMLADTIMTVGGAAPIGIVPRVGRATSVDAGLPIDKVAQIGDGSLSPWLTADGRIVPTGGDHLSYIKEGSYSDHMRATGDIRASFFVKDDGLLGITLHAAEGQELTPKQMGTLSQIVSLRNGDVQIAFGRADGLVNPVYQKTEFSDLPVRAQTTTEGIPPLVQSAADAEPRSAPMAPPATGTVDKAGNINLNRIGGGEDIKQIIRDTAENPNFNPKTRGPMTWEQIDDLAAQTGMDADKLAQRAVGEAWNAEHIDAARQLLYQTTADVRDLGAKIKAGDTSETTLLRYAEAELKQVAVQEQVNGLADEAGRALGIFRKMAGTRQEADAVTEIIASMAGGKNGLIDRAKKIADLNDPAAASRTLREALDPTWKDRFFEVWYNIGLLSNPATHIGNTSSNLAVALWSIPEQGTAGVVGSIRRLLTGSEEGVRVGEAVARMHGLLSGAREGLPAAWEAFKTERPGGAWTAGRDMPLMRAIPSTEGGWGGKQVRLAGRALMAEDEVFRAVGARQELHALALRQAIQEGAGWERYGEILANPTPEMLDAAAKAGAKQIFANPLGTNGQMIQHVVNDFGGGVAKLVVPFIRTPTNIIKYAGERSPLGVFSREVRANLSGANGAAAQDEAIARMFLGTMVSTALLALAAEGSITGGGPQDPEHPGRRAMWLLENQPYHVKVGGYSYDYKRLTGPLGMLLGVVADSKDAAKLMTDGEAKRLAALVGASITNNLVQQTWMQGPADLVKAVSDPQRYGEKWADRLVAGMLVPSVVAQAARLEDPYLKDARTMLDAIKARTPGLSEQVAPKRDIFGRKIDIDTPLVALARNQTDPVLQAFSRLELYPTPPDRKMGGVELTAEQYDRLQFWTGTYMRQMTDTVVGAPGFSQAPVFVQKEMLKGAIEAARRQGVAKTKMGDPELLRSLFGQQIKRVTGAK